MIDHTSPTKEPKTDTATIAGRSFMTLATILTTVMVKGMSRRKQQRMQDRDRAPKAKQSTPSASWPTAITASPKRIISTGLNSNEVQTTQPGATFAKTTKPPAASREAAPPATPAATMPPSNGGLPAFASNLRVTSLEKKAAAPMTSATTSTKGTTHAASLHWRAAGKAGRSCASWPPWWISPSFRSAFCTGMPCRSGSSSARARRGSTR
mmetsp:Transcript_7915/g.22001  ORF Transcript_7915/g.22001 Transcript_7915/m.22001 type:complete len:210 (+) Transcript_7915:64-693(+)